MKQYAVIVDFSHLFHVCKAIALKTPPEYDLKDVTIENVVGKLRTIKKELAKVNIVGYDLVFVEDRPALRKLALLPTYRHGHPDTHIEKQDVKGYLLQNGHITRFCWSDGNEADDSIATVSKLALSQENLLQIIVTSDRDLWQLIGPRVGVFNPISKTFIKEDDIRKAFRVNAIHVPLVKALWGDAGDCVPNVMPRMQKQLIPVVEKTDGTLEAFTTRINNGDRYYLTQECYDRYLAAKDAIFRNYSLVKLDDQCELTWE